MKRYLFITLLLVLCGTNAFADDVTGVTPAAGSAYYIYNVGQNKFLAITNGTVSLSDAGTEFTVDGSAGAYTLTATEGVLGTTYLDRKVSCSSSPYYSTWDFTLISSTDKTYALGCIEDEDNYSYDYLIVSELSETSVSLASEVPGLDDGLWMFTTSNTPAETVSSVDLYEKNTSYSKPTNMETTVDVYLYRSPLVAGVKNSFCVPFDMTSEQLSAAFGTGYALYYYRAYNSDENKVYYSKTTSIEAGKAYIVIPDATAAESDDEKTIREANENTEIKNDEDIRLYHITGVASSSFVSETEAVTHGVYDFKGNFIKQDLSGIYAFDETSGVLKYAQSEHTIYAFRGYFESNTSGAKALTNVVFDDGDATEIESIESEDNLSIYNLNGQLIRKNSQTTSGLAKGVYIVNGKKVVIK